MYIDRVKRTVQTILNTDGRGNFKISDFNNALYNVINEIYEGYLYEVNRMLRREHRGLINGGLENVPDRIREKYLHYLTEDTITVTGGVGALPSDVRYIDTVYTTTDDEVELCKNNKEFKTIANFIHTTPSTSYPIAIQKSTNLNVLPDTITSVVVNYLRQPLIPKWTYQIVGGSEVFDPGAGDFVDLDMHPSEEEHLIRRVLLKFGVNLKEKDIQEIMLREEQIEQQEETRP